MRVVIDTNIAFSGILNTNSSIARIILHPKSQIHIYSTDLLKEEIFEHKEKLRKLSKYSNYELNNAISLIIGKIRFIDLNLIPISIVKHSEEILTGIDTDDTEFVALTDHIRGKLWSGDKRLKSGLNAKGWNKFISTSELFMKIAQTK